jgi:hypothetical protein
MSFGRAEIGFRYTFFAFQSCHLAEALFAERLAKRLGHSLGTRRLWFIQTLSCGFPSLQILLRCRFFSKKNDPSSM